jgi:hypothetical protein
MVAKEGYVTVTGAGPARNYDVSSDSQRFLNSRPLLGMALAV